MDGQAQQESLQVCADVLGRDLKEREAEIVFLRSEICALENMLQAAFKERMRDRETWALEKEVDAMRDAARLQYFEGERARLHLSYEEVELQRMLDREQEMLKYANDVAAAEAMVHTVQNGARGCDGRLLEAPRRLCQRRELEPESRHAAIAKGGARDRRVHGSDRHAGADAGATPGGGRVGQLRLSRCCSTCSAKSRC